MGPEELISQSATTQNLRTLDEDEKTGLSAQVVRWIGLVWLILSHRRHSNPYEKLLFS
jgi:hypothetical protein